MDCMKKELIERLKNFIILYIKNKEKIENKRDYKALNIKKAYNLYC